MCIVLLLCQDPLVKQGHSICRTWNVCLAQCRIQHTSNGGFSVISLSIFSSRWLSCWGSSPVESETRDKRCLAAIFGPASTSTDLLPTDPSFVYFSRFEKVVLSYSTYAHTEGYCKAIPNWVFPFSQVLQWNIKRAPDNTPVAAFKKSSWKVHCVSYSLGSSA